MRSKVVSMAMMLGHTVALRAAVSARRLAPFPRSSARGLLLRSGGSVVRTSLSSSSSTVEPASASTAPEVVLEFAPLSQAAVKEAPPILEVDVEQITGNKAATRLQGASRKTAAYNESKIKVAKRINCSLEHAAERKQNKLDAFMSKLTEKMDTLEAQGQSKDQLLDTIDKMRTAGWPMNLPKDEHPGMDLPSPLTKDAMCDLLDWLTKDRGKTSQTQREFHGLLFDSNTSLASTQLLLR